MKPRARPCSLLDDAYRPAGAGTDFFRIASIFAFISFFLSGVMPFTMSEWAFSACVHAAFLTSSSVLPFNAAGHAGDEEELHPPRCQIGCVRN